MRIEQALNQNGEPIDGIEVGQGMADPAFFYDDELVELRDLLTDYINKKQLDGKHEQKQNSNKKSN